MPHFRSTCLVLPHFTGWQCERRIKGTEYSEVEKNLLYIFPSVRRREEENGEFVWLQNYFKWKSNKKKCRIQKVDLVHFNALEWNQPYVCLSRWMLVLVPLKHGYPTFWLALAVLSEEEMSWAACKIYNIVNVHK